jgi:hypothetical protein
MENIFTPALLIQLVSTQSGMSLFPAPVLNVTGKFLS